MCPAAVLPASFFGGNAGSAQSGDTSGNNGNGGAGGRSGNANNVNSNFNKVFGVAGRKLLTPNWGGQSNSQQVLLQSMLQAILSAASQCSDTNRCD